jgi:hypothetical protein
MVREFVLNGIKHESATVHSDRLTVGGKVDVVLVDKDGVPWK